MTHADNLARVKALRDNRSALVALVVNADAILDHLEDVFTRHAPDDGVCLGCYEAARCAFVTRHEDCPEYASALRLLGALDGGHS